MSFEFESQLCETLLAGWPDPPGPHAFIKVFSELKVGAVIPDLVAIRFRSDTPRRITKQLTAFDSHVLAAIFDRQDADIRFVADALYSRVEKAEPSIRRLQRLGLVEAAPAGGYRVRRAGFPLHADVVAVEAKLVRWKDAVRQAVGYHQFANRVCVALPSAAIDKHFPLIQDACSEHGLGLLEVGSETVHTLLRPPRRRLRTADWAWVVAKAQALTVQPRHATAAGMEP